MLTSDGRQTIALHELAGHGTDHGHRRGTQVGPAGRAIDHGRLLDTLVSPAGREIGHRRHLDVKIGIGPLHQGHAGHRRGRDIEAAPGHQ